MPAIQNGHIQKQNNLDAILSVSDLDALDQYILTSPLAFVGQLVYVEAQELYYSITELAADGYQSVSRPIDVKTNKIAADSHLVFSSNRSTLTAVDGATAAEDNTREYVASATYSEEAALTIGSRTGPKGIGSIVLGVGTVDEADQLTASEASGIAAAAIGVGNMASGFASMAEGWETTAVLFGSHAEGWKTTSTGWAAHAEGELTEAQGFAAHAEGVETVAEGSHSHAGGKEAHALANGSRAAGLNVIASEPGGMAVGKYNVDYSGTETKPIFQVGVGEEGAREDAVLVEADGTVTIPNLSSDVDPGQVVPPGDDQDLLFNDNGTLGARSTIPSSMVDIPGTDGQILFNDGEDTAASSAASVNDDGIQLEKDGGGIVFRSEDGTKYKVTIANDGTPNVTAMTEIE